MTKTANLYALKAFRGGKWVTLLSRLTPDAAEKEKERINLKYLKVVPSTLTYPLNNTH